MEPINNSIAAENQQKQKTEARKDKAKIGGAIVMVLVLIWVGWVFADNWRDVALTYLIGIFGASLGWVVGIISSPYTASERKQFSEYAKVAYGFVTGYLVSKLDRLFELVMTNNLFLSNLYVMRVIFFLSFFIIAALIAFNTRRYGERS